MNLYFLVEGKRTEKKLYPAWLNVLVPALNRVDDISDISSCTYYIFSGEGYPSLLDVHLENAIKDYLACGKFNRMVVCLDVDDSTPEARKAVVTEAAASFGIPDGELTVIAQECCIETWFLGNRKAVSPAPNESRLHDCLEFYNVREDDPERMGFPQQFNARSVFHDYFFKLVSRDKGFKYTKVNPRHVKDEVFLRELIERRNQSDHLNTFGDFLDFCSEIADRC